MSKPFIHLNVHSAYSLCEGAISIKKLVKLCKEHEMPAVALTDTHNLFGALEFSLAAMKEGIQPIIGCKVTLEDASSLVLLCISQAGYDNLMQIINRSYLLDTSYKVTEFETLAQHQEGLIAIGSLSTLHLHTVFQDRFYLGIARYGSNAPDEDECIEKAYELNIPLVAMNEVFFPVPEYHEAHDILLCIGEGRYAVEEDRRKVTPYHYFQSTEEMYKLFEDIPEALDNTIVVAKRCQFLLMEKKPMLPPYPTDTTEEDFLTQEATTGLHKRLEGVANVKVYFERLEIELHIIKTMGFSGYFLIVADFIRWAKSQNIPVGPGRGSGAGSIVAWALTITDIDPIKYDLIFERFLNPERVSMPDFDIDFCQYRRDEVIEYVRQKYGPEKVVQISTFGSLQAKAVLKDVTRVLQLPYSRTDAICKMIPPLVSLDEALLQDATLKETIEGDEKLQHIFKIGLQLEGLYRHVSTHAAGVVIGGHDLSKIVPLYRELGAVMPATQFNMKYIELAGLLKFDFLGLKTLTVIQHCCERVGIDIHAMPIDDVKTFQLLAQPKKVGGIFQLESHGMRDVLSKLKPDRFEDLIALVALYRPGPMDDIPSYLERKHGLQRITYLHPLLEPILKDTYGVMVYQEQVMSIAQRLAGYSLGGADLLRRAMGKKIKEEMDQQQKIFVEGAVKNNVPQDIAVTIFAVMAKFASYGFNKSHSAPYALISYQTAFLKANYKEQFMASIMSLDADNTDKIKAHHAEFSRLNLVLLPPCVNRSYAEFTVEDGQVRFGLKGVKNVSEAFIEKVVAERNKNGDFKDLADFLLRIHKEHLNKKQLESLCVSGALDALYDNRKNIIDHLEPLQRWAHAQQEIVSHKQQTLFALDSLDVKIECLPDHYKDYELSERLKREAEVLGFYLSDHPLTAYKPFMDLFTLSENKKIGVVKRARERISQKGNRYIVVTLSDLEDDFEVMFFKEKVDLYKPLFQEGAVIIVDVTDKEGRYFGNIAESCDATIKKIALHMQGSLENVMEQLEDFGNDGETTITFSTLFEKRKVNVTIPGVHVPLSARH